MVAGYARSGKSALAKHLEEKGYTKIGFSDFIADELKERGLEVTKTNMSNYGERFRKELGQDYLIERVLKKAEGKDKVVISGLRLMREYEKIKEKYPNAKMILTNANEQNRFDRREDESKHLDEFLERDREDDKMYNMHEVFEKMDFVIENNGSFEEFLSKVDLIVKRIEDMEKNIGTTP